MKKKKTLFFHPKNDFTGSTKVLTDIIRKDYYNNTVYIITNNKGDGFLSELDNAVLVNTWVLSWNGNDIKIFSFISWLLSCSILTLIYGIWFDIFYINTTKPFYAALIGRLFRKEIIYHVHEVFPSDSKLKKIYKKVFEATPSHRIFVSAYTKQQFLDNKKCSWEIKYNKLSTDYLRGVHPIPLERRTRNTILMISSLSKAKGIFTFIDVAKLLPNNKFVLVLSSSYNEIRDFLRSDLPNNLLIMPVQKDIHPILEKSDLILNLSIPLYGIETFGMTILEAMPYGIPAIVPNVGGPTELIKDDYNGYCIDVTDVVCVKKHIEKALDETNYCYLSANALKQFQNKFS